MSFVPEDGLLVGIDLFWERDAESIHDPANVAGKELFVALAEENTPERYRLEIFSDFNRVTYTALLHLLDNPNTGKRAVREQAALCFAVLPCVLQEIDLTDPHSKVGRQLQETYDQCRSIFFNGSR